MHSSSIAYGSVRSRDSGSLERHARLSQNNSLASSVFMLSLLHVGRILTSAGNFDSLLEAPSVAKGDRLKRVGGGTCERRGSVMGLAQAR